MRSSLHSDFSVLKRVRTPEKIQAYIERIPFNHELDGETCMSPLRVLHENKAHCIEGAMLACVALMMCGEKPLLMNLKVETTDFDHVVTVFKRGEHYGAISKTNHLVLRYRDPVYRSVRELAMSYFHEYFLTTTGKKTMLGYSGLINMRRFGTQWMTRDDDLWDIAEVIYDMPYTRVTSALRAHVLRNATSFERSGAHIEEWPKKVI